MLGNMEKKCLVKKEQMFAGTFPASKNRKRNYLSSGEPKEIL